MKIWRRLGTRIVLASVACTLLAFGVWGIVTRQLARELVLRAFVPVARYNYDRYERAQCERAPERWTLSLDDGSRAYAYDAATRSSRNPSAPPLDAELLARIAPSDDPPVAFELRGLNRGGAAVLRSGGSGPCAIVFMRWGPRIRPTDLFLWMLVAASGASAIAVGLSFVVVVRPLAARIARLSKAALRVGNADAYAPAEPMDAGAGDEIGEVAASLDRAHARIRADAAALVERQRDLVRHLDDVAHDLRTPITSLQIALEQAADACDDAARAELLTSALRDAVYLGGLTANLRLASQLREGWDPRGEGAQADLGAVALRVTERMRFYARRRGVALDVAVPDGSVAARCNPVAAEQAIGNLVENAITYGDPGGHVAVVLERERVGGFALTVSDDGPGVAPQELPRLGERTFRSDEARQRDPRGSGLGLAIVTEICVRCGWQLTFDDNLPRGLRATVRGGAAAGERAS